MKPQIVSEKEIDAKDKTKLVSRFAKELEMASRLPKGKALKLSYSRHKLADTARETISAVIKRNKLKLKVSIRCNNVYISKKAR
jgi:hypothetical protein